MTFPFVLCVCPDGLSEKCCGFQLFEAEIPLWAREWNCPFCGGNKMRIATESERAEWRRHGMESMEARRDITPGYEP